MFIGLISDTHGVFAPDVRKFLEPVDRIWHAGDFGTLACAATIEAFKPMVGVYGNCDDQDVRQVYPRYQRFECEGVRVLMTHIGLRRGSYWAYDTRKPLYDVFAKDLLDLVRPDIFICGHTHIPQVFRDDRQGFLFMNPGACGYQGSRDVPRMALRFHIDDGKVHDLEKCDLPWNTIQ